jgi:hypothetical protein
MKWIHYRSVVLFFAVLLFSSCAREVYNISWNGIVADKITGQPVADARLIATSSYQHNIDKTAQLNRYAVSDEAGRFSVSFPKGFGLTVKTSASGYLSGVEYMVVKKSSIRDTIFISPHPFNASLVVRVMDFSSFSPSVPFIREYQESNNELTGKKKTVKWGFDFLTGVNTRHLDSADIWVEVNKNNGEIMLNSAAKGGIFPVYNDSSDDFLTSFTKAPESGYANNHLLTGDEAGFFVLCRNGIHVAKMIPESRVCVLKYEKNDGSRVKETGIRFDYLFQPNLKNRLYFPVSASVGNSTVNRDDFPDNRIQMPE